MAIVVILCFTFFACGDESDTATTTTIKTENTTSTTVKTDASTTVGVSEESTTTTVEQETTVTTAEATTTKATTTETTTKSTTQTTSSGITKQEALKIAEDLIYYYNIYQLSGTCCEFEPVDENERQEILSKASYSSDLKQYITTYATISECECCDTYEQAVNHTNKYIDSSMTDEMKQHYKEYYIEYNGNLYVAKSEAAFMPYDRVRVKSFDDNCIIVKAACMGDFDVTFTIKKINGGFKIVDLEEPYVP